MTITKDEIQSMIDTSNDKLMDKFEKRFGKAPEATPSEKPVTAATIHAAVKAAVDATFDERFKVIDDGLKALRDQNEANAKRIKKLEKGGSRWFSKKAKKTALKAVGYVGGTVVGGALGQVGANYINGKPSIS